MDFLSNQLYCFGFNLNKKFRRKSKYLQSIVDKIIDVHRIDGVCKYKESTYICVTLSTASYKVTKD